MAYHIRSPTEGQKGMPKEAYIISKWERKRKMEKRKEDILWEKREHGRKLSKNWKRVF